MTLASGALVALERRTCPELGVGTFLESNERQRMVPDTCRPFLRFPYSVNEITVLNMPFLGDSSATTWALSQGPWTPGSVRPLGFPFPHSSA